MSNSKKYNITYLLGAGASAKALPTVRKTEISVGIFDALIETSKFIDNDKNNLSNKNIAKVDELITDLHWLSKESKNNGTPDTYAKFLYLKQHNQLFIRLKKTLAYYFVIEQIVRKKRDERAKIFLTSILNNQFTFPDNVKIITWNYDFQIQLASESFLPETIIREHGLTMETQGLINYFPPIRTPFWENYNMTHLNGIAGFYPSDYVSYKSVFENPELRTLEKILAPFYWEEFTRGNVLSFAWEENNMNLQSKSIALKFAEETEILVIIGYSFPHFNKEIDRLIFNTLIKNRLKKIYYQDPYITGEFLKSNFELPDSIIIKHVNEVDNYFLPNEL